MRKNQMTKAQIKENIKMIKNTIIDNKRQIASIQESFVKRSAFNGFSSLADKLNTDKAVLALRKNMAGLGIFAGNIKVALMIG